MTSAIDINKFHQYKKEGLLKCQAHPTLPLLDIKTDGNQEDIFMELTGHFVIQEKCSHDSM